MPVSDTHSCRRPKRPSSSSCRSSSSSNRGPYNVPDTPIAPSPDVLPWHYHPSFARYWRHYHQVIPPASFPPFLHAVTPDPLNLLFTSRHRRPQKSLYCRRHRLGLHHQYQHYRHQRPTHHHKHHDYSSHSDLDINQAEETDADLTDQLSFGMQLSDREVSEEFLAFMMQTEKHRQEYRKRKEAMKQCGDLQEAADSVSGDREHPDSVRTREMKELYGEAASRLHAMETAVQLTFDRVATRKHAQLWPNIPLNVVFCETGS